MQGSMALDFKKLDVDSFLFGAIPVRFQDTSSQDFQDFIAHLFVENGYVLKQADFSRDFGADLIVMNEGVKTAVRVRRYHEVHKLGISDLQQIIGAQAYYNCQQSMVITSSSFTAAARELAATHEVILWDWTILSQAISDTFFSGMDYFTYFKKYPGPTLAEDKQLSFSIQRFEYIQAKDQSYTVLDGERTNASENAIRVHCDRPIYINHKRKQYAAINWSDDSFVNGIIHPEAVVTLTFRFSGRHISTYHSQDRLILILHTMPQGETIMLEQKMATHKPGGLLSRIFRWPLARGK